MWLSKVIYHFSFFNIFNSLVRIVSLSTQFIFIYGLKDIYLSMSIYCDRKGCYDFMNNVISIFVMKTRSLTYFFLCFFFLFFWKHVIYVGRFFMILNYRKLRVIFFFLGYSHITKLKLKNIWAFFKVRRKVYLWYTFSYNFFSFLLKFIPFIKPVGIYTGRGFRFLSQCVVKRVGKLAKRVRSGKGQIFSKKR